MKPRKEIKYHKSTFKVIEQLELPKKGKIKFLNSEFKNVELEPCENKFQIDFDIDVSQRLTEKIHTLESLPNARFYDDKQEIILEDLYINSVNTKISNTVSTNLTGIIRKFHTKGFKQSTEQYYRLIIPIQYELAFHKCLFRSSYETKEYKSTLHTEINHNNSKIELYNVKYKERNYAIIDYEQKIKYEDFTHICLSALISYGYVTGFMPGEKGYYVTYKNKNRDIPTHVYFNSLRESSMTGYIPVTIYPFGYGIKPKIDYSIRTISTLEFSKLFSLVNNSIEFTSTLLLMIESSNASLLFRPCGYAVCLETLSDLIISDFKKLGEKSNLNPIKDKKLNRKILAECNEIISNNCYHLDQEYIKVLKDRIGSNLNKPTNKDRLKAPFDLLGLKLKEEDEMVLLKRNDFLHGRIPAFKTLDEIDRDLLYSSLSFYTLLNMLIMKWIGYDDRVVNYPKIHEGITLKELNNEDYFRKLD